MAAKRPAQTSRTTSHTTLRIIGGTLKGSKILYPGEPGTRPMKDRVREAVFNLLGPAVKSTLAIDLFAGTGAVALEAISRGATNAIAIEQNFPMAGVIQKNAAAMGVADRIQVHAGDAFIWGQALTETTISTWGQAAWTIFCCPPYALYENRLDQMLGLIERLFSLAPTGSAMMVEADERFDFTALPGPDAWDIRHYPPAHVGLVFKTTCAFDEPDESR